MLKMEIDQTSLQRSVADAIYASVVLRLWHFMAEGISIEFGSCIDHQFNLAHVLPKDMQNVKIAISAIAKALLLSCWPTALGKTVHFGILFSKIAYTVCHSWYLVPCFMVRQKTAEAVLDALVDRTQVPDQYEFHFTILDMDSFGVTPLMDGYKFGCKTNFHRLMDIKVCARVLFASWCSYELPWVHNGVKSAEHTSK